MHSSDDSPSSTNRLAGRAGGGDGEAMERLYTKLVPALFAYASLRLGGRWTLAEDVVSEVWLRLLPRLGEYDPQRSFRAWVFGGFAQRVVQEFQRDALRRSREAGDDRHVWEDVPVEISSVGRQLANDESLHGFVSWVRDSLSPYQQEVFLRRGLLRQRPPEIAELLGRTEKAIRVCWHQVYKRIRERSQEGPPAAAPAS